MIYRIWLVINYCSVPACIAQKLTNILAYTISSDLDVIMSDLFLIEIIVIYCQEIPSSQNIV